MFPLANIKFIYISCTLFAGNLTLFYIITLHRCSIILIVCNFSTISFLVSLNFYIFAQKILTFNLKRMTINHNYKFCNLIFAGLLLTMFFALSSCSNDDSTADVGITSNPYDNLKPIGFGEKTTGGNNQNITIVTTAEQLAEAVSGTNPATIYVQGNISLNKMLAVGSNKSIIGLSGATISNLNRNDDAGIFLLKGSNNVIIGNLTLLGPGAYDIDANYSDNISLVGAKNVWVDHCDIQDGIDGNFDIVEGSDSICVSWTRFHYLIAPKEGGSGGSSDHRNSNKSADLDEGHLNCTFICCWWGEGCSERCPRVRFGKVHVANCLYDGNDYNYCIGYGVYSNIYVEKCAFVSEAAKEKAIKDWHNGVDHNIKLTGCLGVDDIELSLGNRGQFVPTYDYKIFDASMGESKLKDSDNGAGATLLISLKK